MQIDVFQAFEPYCLTHYTGDEWSVMALLRSHDDGILGSNKEVLVLGDGVAAKNKGFHLGLQKQV